MEAQGIDAARCRECLALDRQELTLLGINPDIRFANGRRIDPVALFTVASSPYRVADLYSDAGSAALSDMFRTLAANDADTALESFAVRLVTAVVAYQRLGAVNDTLGVENVVVSGQVTDFEWFFAPGIPLPDGSTSERLEERQHKEGFYLAETLLYVASALGLQASISAVSRRALRVAETLGELDTLPPVVQQLREFAG
jgi:hypothetical protein